MNHYLGTSLIIDNAGQTSLNHTIWVWIAWLWASRSEVLYDWMRLNLTYVNELKQPSLIGFLQLYYTNPS